MKPGKKINTVNKKVNFLTFHEIVEFVNPLKFPIYPQIIPKNIGSFAKPTVADIYLECSILTRLRFHFIDFHIKFLKVLNFPSVFLRKVKAIFDHVFSPDMNDFSLWRESDSLQFS